MRRRACLGEEVRCLRAAFLSSDSNKSAGSSSSYREAYDTLLDKFPYSTKAVSTGLTYIASDATAQLAESFAFRGTNNEEEEKEGGSRTSISERALRSLKFGAVGCFWVGPLLTAWFNVMDHFVPGKAFRSIAVKLVADQVLQGPFMIGTMYFWTAVANGKTPAEVKRTLDDKLWGTWVNSVYVWGPVQVCQQAVVPLRYRVLVANVVSYFWDTYLSFMMMSEQDQPSHHTLPPPPPPQLQP